MKLYNGALGGGGGGGGVGGGGGGLGYGRSRKCCQLACDMCSGLVELSPN